MINAKKFDKLTYIEDGIEKQLDDVMVVPVWLLKSILEYDNELLQQPYGNLTDYGKAKVDILKAQHSKLSINTERK